MEYICSSNNKLSNDQISYLGKNAIKVKHIALYHNIYVLEANSLDIIKQIGFFVKARKSRKFKLAYKPEKQPDVIFVPHISRNILRSNQKFGWSMKVAVLDSGVQKEYLDKLNEQESRDYTGFGNVIVNNHGTLVAKIINYYAPGAQIVSIKVAHYGQDIIEGSLITALDYCVDREIDIINMSLEIGDRSECNGNCELCDYINAVCDSGKVVVTVSGNFGDFDGNTIGCPGRAEKAVTVGAISPDGKLSESSGKGVPGFLKPNMVAPGSVKVLLGKRYIEKSGTSFAAPIVTGVLTALIPHFGEEFAISTLYETCNDIGYLRHEQGFGLLNIDKLTEVCDDEQAIPGSSSG